MAKVTTQRLTPKNRSGMVNNPSRDLNPTFDNGITIGKGPPRADIAIAAPKPTFADVLTEWGSTGTIIIGGILSNVDYNPDLTGTQRVAKYDEMRKGDATVRAALLAVKLPILAANWYIKSATEDQQADKDIADFIDNKLFHEMDITWSAWLTHCMNYLDFGSMLFEKIYNVDEQGRVGWKKFAPRLTNTIYRWRMPDNQTEGVTQILPTGGLRGIPLWKCLLFVNEQEGEDYEGISILRAAYQSYVFKQALYRIDAIAAERQGLGIPYVKVPPNANDQDRNTIDELLRNIRANETANMQIPVGWDVGFMDMHASQTKNLKDMIMHYDRQISKSVLAQFLELGSNQVGSFALSSDQSQLFLLAEKKHAETVADTVNYGAIEELVDFNFQVGRDPKTGAKKYPTLEVGRIGNVDVEKLSIGLFRLAQGGLLTATPEIEEYIRNILDLPEAASTSEEEFQTEDTDLENKPLPTPPKSTPIKKPSTFSEKQWQQFENKNASEWRDIKSVVGMDVRQMRRDIQDIIHAKQK